MLIAGLAAGLAHALFILGGLWEVFPQYKLPLLAVVTARWATLSLVAAACLQAGWSWLDRREQRQGAATVLQQSFAVLAATACAELAGEPLALLAASGMHGALNVPVRPFWAGRPWPAVLLHMWSQGGPSVLVVCALATAIRAYARSLRDAGEALRRTQLAVAESQRRAVAQRLQSTQAAVDPPFLFSTLRAIEAAFVGEPARADGLLDALIRYLRAALPAAADGGCTLGEQADLVRAWADIVAASHGDAMHASVDVPPGLRPQPFAPLLLLPLVAGAANARARRVALRAWSEPGQLVVELAAEGVPPHALTREFAAARERLAVLYGDTASFETPEADACVRIRLQLPADP
jgi:hypothetical protein